MSELDSIKQRYEDRKHDPRVAEANKAHAYIKHIKQERQKKYGEVLSDHFTDLSNIRLLEIGAGAGDNLLFFHQLGIPWDQIWANELLEDRGEILRSRLETPHIHIGDALQLEVDEPFDVVFQSTVFTSILDADFKIKLANKMLDLTRTGGIILWYDFTFDNPRNKAVKGVKKQEIEELFSTATSIRYYPVTLAPPIGRRIGNLYTFVNAMFPFLKTHVIAVIEK